MVVWRRHPPRTATGRTAEREIRLRLRPGASPRTAAEHALALLVGPGRARREVEHELALDLLEKEVRQGGWALDLTLWGCCLFEEEARRLVDRHLETLLVVER